MALRAASKGIQNTSSLLRLGLGAEQHSNALAAGQVRGLGGSGVPEFWGKPSEYTPGTEFLGTPKNHLELVHKRPVSPHVFEIDNKGPHYKMPINAVTSVVNRATGFGLSVGCTAAGWIALTGDLPGTVEAFQTSFPLLVYPAKAAIAFPLIYHYFGGVRHMFWDHSKIGKQAEKTSLLENSTVDKLSWALIGASAVGTVAAALV